MHFCSASLLTEDWAEIRLYIRRGCDGYVILEDKRRDDNAVKSKNLLMHQEPP